MSYDINSLFSVRNCRVVFGLVSSDADRLKEAVCQREACFQRALPSALGPKKLGPFKLKNRTRLWDILKKTEEAKKQGADFLNRQMKLIRLYAYEARFPSVLSEPQLERASALYGALSGQSDFLINDWDTIFEDNENFKSNGAIIANWLYRYKRRQRGGYRTFNMIWLTDLKDYEVMELLGEEGRQSAFYSFFTIKDGALIRCHPDRLMESYQEHLAKEERKAAEQKRKAEQEAGRKAEEEKKAPAAAPAATKPASATDPAEEHYQEGRKYDTFSGYGLKTAENDPQRAISFYTLAAKSGNLKAQNCLGAIYHHGFHVVDINMANAIYLFTLAVFNKSYNEASADEDTKWGYNHARESLKQIMKQTNNGIDIVRQIAGDDAKDFIAEVEEEISLAKHFHKVKERIKKEWEEDEIYNARHSR